jgi:hypothetical protein
MHALGQLYARFRAGLHALRTLRRNHPRATLAKMDPFVPRRPPIQQEPDQTSADLDRREITLDAVAKVVDVAGTGPAEIVMIAMPGISPHVARFSRWVRNARFTEYMPRVTTHEGLDRKEATCRQHPFGGPCRRWQR